MGMEEKGRNLNPIGNPGLMASLNEKCKKLFPVYFDGLRVTVIRDLSKHFRVSHFTCLSSITPGPYRFGATYVGTKQIKPDVAYPILDGNIDCKGNLNASISHLFGSRIKMKFDTQMGSETVHRADLATHYMGDTFTASILLLNRNVLKNSGGILLQFLQNVTSRWALGAEFAFLNNMETFKQQGLIQQNGPYSQVSVCARYTNDNSCWSTMISVHNVLLSYYSKASEQLSFGMEINTNLRTNQSTSSLAYQVDLKDRGIVCKGMVDTNCNVGSLFETRFLGSPFTFTVSSNYNLILNNFRLGCGFVVQ